MKEALPMADLDIFSPPRDTLGLTPEDVAEAQGYSVLGPGYFAARRFMDHVLRGDEAPLFADLVKKAADDLYEQALEAFQASLISDASSNIGGHILRMVEDTVHALITGEEWALRQYPLTEDYDGLKLRAALLRHCGARMLPVEAKDGTRWTYNPTPALTAEERHRATVALYRQERRPALSAQSEGPQ